MDARTKKLTLFYGLSEEEAQVLVDAELDTPRKVKDGIDESDVSQSIKDKVAARNQ